MFVCLYVPFKLETLLADFDVVCFIELLKTTKNNGSNKHEHTHARKHTCTQTHTYIRGHTHVIH